MLKKGNSMVIQTKTFSGKTFNLSKYSTHMSIWSPHTEETNIVHHVGKPAYIENLWKKIKKEY